MGKQTCECVVTTGRWVVNPRCPLHATVNLRKLADFAAVENCAPASGYAAVCQAPTRFVASTGKVASICGKPAEVIWTPPRNPQNAMAMCMKCGRATAGNFWQAELKMIRQPPHTDGDMPHLTAKPNYENRP